MCRQDSDPPTGPVQPEQPRVSDERLEDLYRWIAKIARLRFALEKCHMATKEIAARRAGCDHCESTAAELEQIIEQARKDVAPIIEAEAEGERRAKDIMDLRLRAGGARVERGELEVVRKAVRAMASLWRPWMEKSHPITIATNAPIMIGDLALAREALAILDAACGPVQPEPKS